MARVLFIQRSLTENISIMQLSAVLKEHKHACDVLLALDKDKISIDALTNYKPDLIAFSLMTPDRGWCSECASHIKACGFKTPIIVGGPHPTFFPDYINEENIDIINIGEGEFSLLELVTALDAGKDYSHIKNLYVKKNDRVIKNPLRPLVGFNKIPNPDREIYFKYKDYFKLKFYMFYVSRGCPYHCKFCFIHQVKELYKNDPGCNKMRLKPVDDFIAEYKQASAMMKIPMINFLDSTFNLDKKWTMEFLAMYKKEIGVPYTLNLRANLVDEDIVKAIADTQCCSNVRIGIEVGNEEYRCKILGKNISNERIYSAVDLLKKYKVGITTYSMYGLPGETLENAFETIAMNQRIQPEFIIPFIFNPFPGLDITNYAIENGYLRVERSDKNAEMAKKSADTVSAKDVHNNINLCNLSVGKGEYYFSALIQPDIDTIVNLGKLSILIICYPWLGPLIRKLIRYNPRKIYNYIYMISVFLQYKKIFKMNLMETIRYLRNYG